MASFRSRVKEILEKVPHKGKEKVTKGEGHLEAIIFQYWIMWRTKEAMRISFMPQNPKQVERNQKSERS